ncbi:MAG: UDP-N-acetylmuramoyl-L-alanyl-D-glutamate--2,6-diaminopimelate ligase [Methyloprofundus sp.]|nr:UDP-N-acetylmuramoyl-L-alanyl-D-glutamate--2,6-diaminopimelate ligase [Methyloprofundus sp.]
MWLAELLTGFAVVETDIEFTQIALDSQEINAGGVFFAIAGTQQHGLRFAEKVQQQGGLAIVYDPAKKGTEFAKNIKGLPMFAVEDLTAKLGEIASRFYACPSAQLNIIGITGTNGKTSCSQFLAQVMEASAVIGTLGWGKYSALQVTRNTTPDAFAVQKMLVHFIELGVKNVAMEVSSHGLVQGRVNAINFQGVIFNNLSRDHLDYHGSMEAYLQAKLRLVQWPGLKYVVVNLDDAYAERVLLAIPEGVRVLTYSVQGKVLAIESSISVSDIQYTMAGIECNVFWQGQQAQLQVSLLGDFNLQNVLAVLAVMLAMDKPLTECLQAMQSIKSVIGRMECFQGKAGKPLMVVDYAHTPDALSKVLTTLRHHCDNKLTVIFGCGGERDKGKRGEMGKIAEQLADAIIVTDDNPRFESGPEIIEDIIAGIKTDKLSVIGDRENAIKHGIMTSSEQDIVLVAGKGHEDYQERQGIKYPFSDRDIVQRMLAL